jgi:hypothetical protein
MEAAQASAWGRVPIGESAASMGSIVCAVTSRKMALRDVAES